MNDCDNYRGISLLSPIAKIFEMILASQIEQYFELNELFHPSQNGFGKNYSCETALHEIRELYLSYFLMTFAKPLTQLTLTKPTLSLWL